MSATIFYDDAAAYSTAMSRAVEDAPEHLLCARCNKTKPVSDFPVTIVKGKLRYWSYCTVCRNSYARDARTANLENRRVKERKYYQDNAERKRELARISRTPEKTKHGALRRYGISLYEYRELLASQGGVCAICQEPPTGSRKYLAVDHDHVTGKIRGLLCIRCNMAIGGLRDDIGLVRAALAYLEKEVVPK